jgi:hypothetical protein
MASRARYRHSLPSHLLLAISYSLGANFVRDAGLCSHRRGGNAPAHSHSRGIAPEAAACYGEGEGIHELHASGKYASQVHCTWNWTGKLEMLLARVQNNTVWIAIKLSVCSILPPFYILCHLIWVVFVSFVQLYSIVFGEASCTQFYRVSVKCYICTH